MKNRCVLFFAFFCIASACTYEPDGAFINPEIYRPPDTLPASIDIDDVEGEFKLAAPTFFWASVDRVGKTLIHFKVYSEGREIHQTIQDKLGFLLDPDLLSNGRHEYDIEVKLSTGSGSIAEGFGLEYYLIQKKLVVTVDRSVPNAVTGLSATMVNGDMTLTWNKPSHEHFYYAITKHNEHSNYIDAFIIRDTNITTFVDKGFVGGKVSYHVVLQSSFFYVESAPATYELTPIEVMSTLDEDNHLKLKWNVLTEFGSDVSVRISGRRFTKDFPWASDENDVDTLYLGDVLNINLKVFRNGFEDAFSVSSNHSIGTRIKAFDSYCFLESSNKLILHQVTGSAKTYRYDATTFAVEDSLYFPGYGYTLVSSENGTRQHLISGPDVFSFNPMNLSEPTTQLYLNSIYRTRYGRDLEHPGPYSISNDNLLVFTNRAFLGQQISHTIVTIDLTTKELWGTEKSGTNAAISGDGNFMIVTDVISEADAVIYKRGVSDWEEIGKVPFGKMFFSRYPGTRLIRSANGETSVYDLTSAPNGEGFFSETASASIAATAFDRTTNRIIQEIIGEESISVISTYSLDNLELISTHRARVTPDIGDDHFITGNKQLVTSGYIKHIE